MSGHSLIDVIGGVAGGFALGLVASYLWRQLCKDSPGGLFSGGWIPPDVQPHRRDFRVLTPTVLPPDAPPCPECKDGHATRQPTLSPEGRCPVCRMLLRFPNSHRRMCSCGFTYLAPNAWRPHRCPECRGWQHPYDANGEPLERPHQPPPPPPPPRARTRTRGITWSQSLIDATNALDWLERYYAGEVPDGFIWTEGIDTHWRPYYRPPLERK